MFAVRYLEIVEILHNRIADGVYPQRLPALRTLCEEFGVCKATMSKVFEKLAYAGVVNITPRGTFVLHGESRAANTGCMVAIITRKLAEHYQVKDDEFINALKRELQKRGFASAKLEIENNSWNDQAFWQHLAFDGYIFVYSSFYQFPFERVSLCSKPRVVGNWLPDEKGEYSVDFGEAAGLKEIVERALQLGYKNIALAINVPNEKCSEAYFNYWRKLMRNCKLNNYNSALEDFCYSPQVAERWTAHHEPPDLVLCANVPPETVENDLPENCKNTICYNLGNDAAAYLRLAKVLAQTFTAVFYKQDNVPKRNLIGRYGAWQLKGLPEKIKSAAESKKCSRNRKKVQ